jgi:hypothetical protein
MHAVQKETPASGSNHTAGVNTFSTIDIVPQSPATDKLFSTLQAHAALGGITLERYRHGYSLQRLKQGHQFTHLFSDLTTAQVILQRLGLMP